MMPVGVQLKVVEADDDYLKLQISVGNGQFAGTTEVYAGLSKLDEFAQELAGFPRAPSDGREVNFGDFGSNSAGGAVFLRFYCADQAGHSYVDIKLESAHNSKGT